MSEIEELVEPIALAFLARWYDWQGDPEPWWKAVSPDRQEDARDAARAVLQSDAITALIKREGELRGALERVARHANTEIAVRRIARAALNPNTESE